MTIITALIVFALIATIAAFGLGLGSMAHGGKFDAKHDTQFMAARVGFQGLTVILLLITLYLAAS